MKRGRSAQCGGKICNWVSYLPAQSCALPIALVFVLNTEISPDHLPGDVHDANSGRLSLPCNTQPGSEQSKICFSRLTCRALRPSASAAPATLTRPATAFSITTILNNCFDSSPLQVSGVTLS